jgi:hypothetical protein
MVCRTHGGESARLFTSGIFMSGKLSSGIFISGSSKPSNMPLLDSNMPLPIPLPASNMPLPADAASEKREKAPSPRPLKKSFSGGETEAIFPDVPSILSQKNCTTMQRFAHPIAKKVNPHKFSPL